MMEFQQRVVDEQTDLDGKIRRLCAFIGSDAFAEVSPAERGRLLRQAKAMESYDAVLLERIGAFS